VSYVDPTGLASSSGLVGKSPKLDGHGLCNWWITEINHHPLNLFCTKNEVSACVCVRACVRAFVCMCICTIKCV